MLEVIIKNNAYKTNLQISNMLTDGFIAFIREIIEITINKNQKSKAQLVNKNLPGNLKDFLKIMINTKNKRTIPSASYLGTNVASKTGS